MSDAHFDFLVLGSGPSSSTLVKHLTEAGRKVAVASEEPIGGVCALRGCNPKKVLTNAGTTVDQARRAVGKLLGHADVAIDWPKLMAFRAEFTDPVPASKADWLDHVGAELFRGVARFVGPDRVAVGDRTVSADHIVIATGAKPAALPFPGSEHLVASDEFLYLKDLPRRLLFVGGGYISFEFGHMARHADRAVTMVDENPRPLHQYDADLVAGLVDRTRRMGIDFRTETGVGQVRRHGDGFRVVLTTGEAVDADIVVHGAGRAPNIAALDLTAGDVAFDEKKGVLTDEFLRSTSNSKVWACGDVAATGGAKLTPVANRQAETLARNLVAGDPLPVDDRATASAVFTTPPLAMVGPTEQQLIDAGTPYEKHGGDLSSKGAIRKLAATHARAKILSDPGSGRLLAAHLFGPWAADLINVFTLAVDQRLTIDAMRNVLWAFPTSGAEIEDMLG